MNRIKHIAVIGCGAQKLDRPAPAGQLYTSDLFLASRTWAEVACDAWFVLSGKHGLVEQSLVLEPYDFRVDVMAPGHLERWAHYAAVRLEEWIDKTHEQGDDEHVHVLAGNRYARPLIKRLWTSDWPLTIHEPLRGMGIGRRKQWLALDTQRAVAHRDAASRRAGGSR
jgi:hypothetical protein